MKELINIPKGNAFRLHVCPQRIAPKQENASFAQIDGLTAHLIRPNGEHLHVTYSITEEGDLIVNCPGTLKCVTYGLELTGTYNGDAWRWADCNIFHIVDCNPCGNVWGMESFAPEVYYIYDDIEPTIEDGKLKLGTHAHAWFEGTELHLMEDEFTTITIDNGILNIYKHGRESDKGCNTRPARQCFCR